MCLQDALEAEVEEVGDAATSRVPCGTVQGLAAAGEPAQQVSHAPDALDFADEEELIDEEQGAAFLQRQQQQIG